MKRLHYLYFLFFFAGTVLWAQEPSLVELEQQPDRWPEEVTTKVAIQVKLMADGKEIGSMLLPVGGKGKPMELKQGILKIEVLNARGEIAVTDTDFLENLKTVQPKQEVTPETNAEEIGVDQPPPTQSSADPAVGAMWQKLNKTFGATVWQDDQLWDDDAAVVAKRLAWPEESRTETQGSYRLYAKENVQVLGTRPYSLALYQQQGKPDRFSMMFANKGDFEGFSKVDPSRQDEESSKERREREKDSKAAIKGFPEAVKQDRDTIEKKLIEILGEPQRQHIGSGDMKESVDRWDWQGHAILLASPKGEYTAVRIISTELADNRGRVARVSDSDLKEILKRRVLTRPNGDVVIQQIPMVDQGPKGFCVPATWERYLRYLEMPADMYVLAMAGGTGLGGGTYTSAIKEGADRFAKVYSRKIEDIDPSLEIKDLAKYIDQGLPVMWSCYVNPVIEGAFTKRTLERRSVTDWDGYATTLEKERKSMSDRPVRIRDSGHMRLIIGYNEKTSEIAISDSWGKGSEERWLTLEEAKSTTQSELTIIKW